MAKSKNEFANKFKSKEQVEFIEIQNFVNRTELVMIIPINNSEIFWPDFFEKYPDFEQRKIIIDYIIDKISTHEKLNINKKNSLQLDSLKGETLLFKAQNALDIIISETSVIKKELAAPDVIEVTESAYAVYQKLFNKSDSIEKKELLEKQILLTKETLNKAIIVTDNIDKQFELLEQAFIYRLSNLPENKQYTVELLTQLAYYGIKTKNIDIKLKALCYAEDAYNIIFEQAKIDEKSQIKLLDALVMQKDLYSEFGDKGKAKIIEKQISTKLENSIPIVKHSIIDKATLDIKQKIQENILNKIQEQSAKGKWIETKYLTEWGISGYLQETWLKGQLGTLNTEENYKIALGLCFEAINIGIMNSEDKNPICAAIFASKYPEIIKYILTDNPEYFVDGYILKTSCKDAYIYSQELTKEVLNKNSAYNKYFEEAVTPVIAKYIHNSLTYGWNVTNDILNPIKEIIKNDNWSENIKSQLMGKITNEYINKALGNNFTQIDDVCNIVRIMAFNSITSTIKECGSQNYNSIISFKSTYPELTQRIVNDHESFLINSHIKNLCTVEVVNVIVSGTDIIDNDPPVEEVKEIGGITIEIDN